MNLAGLPFRLRPLDCKLLRDLWGMKMQAMAIGLVIAGGVSVHLLAAGMLTSLEETRSAYYDRYLFADVWAPVVRAPAAKIDDIRAIAGVQAVETRVRAGVLFDVPGMSEPASGEVISLPDASAPAVNRLHLVRGRMPEPGHRDEVVMLQGFADAHALGVGDTVRATIHGGRSDLTIVGIALSPEHVYTVAPGEIVPDDRLFGVLWMSNGALAARVDQDGAFNEAVLRLTRDGSAAAVIDALDRLLEPHGAAGAYGRADQFSDAFVSSEIDQLTTMGAVLPPVFLLVAAFLVNVVISRTVAVQRAGIGLLKAFGYGTGEIVRHYLKLVGAIAAIGLAIGGAAGVLLGRMLAKLYIEYFHFPFLVFAANPQDYALVAVIAVVAVLGGAALAVRRIADLSPAQAMTPPPPPDYSRAAGIGVTRMKLFDQQTRMILRQIVRWPWRAGLTTGGIAAAGALLIGTVFFMDSMRLMIDVSFNVAARYDIAVTFVEPRSRAAHFSLERAPGVLAAEPFRAAPARLRHGHLEKRAAITGVPPDAMLSRLVDDRYRPVRPTDAGLVLSRDLAEALDLRAGDIVQVRITEGRRPTLDLPVARIATTFVGSGAYLPIATLNRLLGEGPVVSGVYLTVDELAVDSLYARLKAAPAVAGVALKTQATRKLTEMLEENLGISIAVYTVFAGLIALGVVYNSVRISFAERQRELASLRVLGFSRNDVSYILLGEVGFLTLLALPLGGAAGAALAWFLARAMSSDMFRLPFVIEPSTFGFAAASVLAVTVASSLLVRGQINRLDMVSALKTGE